MHTDKYYAREGPIKMSVPDITGALSPGWRRIDYDVNGEWNYYQILAEYLSSDQEAERAAAGWGGDRYAVYEQAQTGRVLITQATAWDTEQDAREFADAYAKRVEKRYRDAAPEAQPSAPAFVRNVWRTGEGLVVMQRQGAHVVILEGLPEKANVNALLKM